MNVHIRKKKWSKINNLTFQIRKLKVNLNLK